MTTVCLKFAVAMALGIVFLGQAQQPPDRPEPRGPGRPGFDGPPPEFRRGGGPPMGAREEYKLRKQFDKDKDKVLNLEERQAAREFIKKERAEGRGPRRPGPPGGFGGGRGPRGGGPGAGIQQGPVEPGEKVSPADVKTHPDAPLYDLSVVRTFFIEFESKDWEAELADFYNTDVEVPVTLTVDGKTYKNVGVHFRGASSFFTVSEGRKRSLNLSMDFVDEKQNLGGYRTLNLLNSHTDPTFLRSVLYYQAARDYIPAPKANYVRVVINGENWGIFINAQQFNKEFTQDWFASTKGARWKAPGRPNGNAGLTYLGEDIEAYKRTYEIKSKDDPASWRKLIELCRVLNETPREHLIEKLSPILDIDGALKFLALENALINSDGYWIRSSDYNLYLDEKGRFHLVPHDSNETFSAPQGPGRGGGGGVEVDPLEGIDDPGKPLISRLLSVPKLREQYLGYVRDIATKWLDWQHLGPLAKKYQALIAEDVKKDTHKLYPTEAFADGLTEDVEEQGGRGPRRRMSLKSFADQRRAYLLSYQPQASRE